MARRKMTKEEKVEWFGYEETLDEFEARLFGEPVDSFDEDEYTCCSSCGNPAYPKCKASCKLFDD